MHRLFALPCRTAAITVALALGAVAPASAETIAPPGNSGVDQYMEVVPSAKGPAAPGTPQAALSSAVQRRLQSQGAEGRQLEQIVKATAPARPTTGSRPKREATGPAAAHSAADRPAPVPRGDAPLASVAKAIGDGSGSGGMGSALPLLLVVSTTVLAGLALWRRRSA